MSWISLSSYWSKHLGSKSRLKSGNEALKMRWCQLRHDRMIRLKRGSAGVHSISLMKLPLANMVIFQCLRMLFYGQRKRVWKTSFWSWKGDAASIMPGPYSLTVTILHQIKDDNFHAKAAKGFLKNIYIYIYKFWRWYRDTSRIYAGRDGAGTTQELWCWLSMTKQFVFGGMAFLVPVQKIIAMHKRSWND